MNDFHAAVLNRFGIRVFSVDLINDDRRLIPNAERERAVKRSVATRSRFVMLGQGGRELDLVQQFHNQTPNSKVDALRWFRPAAEQRQVLAWGQRPSFSESLHSPRIRRALPHFLRDIRG